MIVRAQIRATFQLHMHVCRPVTRRAIRIVERNVNDAEQISNVCHQPLRAWVLCELRECEHRYDDVRLRSASMVTSHW